MGIIVRGRTIDGENYIRIRDLLLVFYKSKENGSDTRYDLLITDLENLDKKQMEKFVENTPT